MLLGEISGPSALVKAGECGDKSGLKLRVEREKPTPVLFGTSGRLKRTRCGSIALGEFHMMDDSGGGYSGQAWSGQVCPPGARRWSYRSAKDSFPSLSRKENTSHGTRVLARVGREMHVVPTSDGTQTESDFPGPLVHSS